MPYTWIEPEVALEHKDVKVYHTYKDDFLDQGANTYWFVMDPTESEDEWFDVRDLPTWEAPDHPPFLVGENDTPENQAAWREYYAERVEWNVVFGALRKAIDQGLLPSSSK